MAAYSALGTAFIRKGEYDNAVAALERAVSIDPDNADVACALAGVFLNKGIWGSAVDAAERAIEADPEHVAAHTNLAE